MNTDKKPSSRSQKLSAGQLTMLQQVFAKNWCSSVGREANIFWSLIRRGLIERKGGLPPRLTVTPEGLEILKKYGGMK